MTYSVDGVLGRVSSAMTSAVNGLSGNLIDQGNKAVLALLMCMVMYHLIMTFVGEDWGTTQVNLMQLLIKWAIVTFLLSNWGAVGSFFTDGFKEMASAAAGGDKKNAVDMGIEVLKKLFGVGLQDSNGNPCPFLGCNPPSNKDIALWDKAQQAVAALGFSFTNGLLMVIGFITKIIAAVSVIFMIASAGIVSLYGHFMVAVGLVVGPIMIPFFLVPSLSFLFQSWLKFMISGGMVYIVSSITIVFVGAAFEELNKISGVALNGTDLGVDIMALLMIALIAGMGSYLVMQAPEFAKSLMGGSIMEGASKAAKQSANDAKAVVKTAASAAKAAA